MEFQYGYFEGLKQPSLTFSLTTKNFSELDLSILDCWLLEYFEVENLPEINELLIKAPPSGAKIIRMHQFAGRILSIYKLLMEASYLPIVTTGKIVTVKMNDHESELQLMVPVVSEIVPAVFEDLLQASYRIAISLAHISPTPSHATKVFDQLEEKLFKKFRRQMPDGRANSFIAGLACKLGYPFEHLGHGIMQIGHGVNAVILQRSSSLFDSAIGACISADKIISAQILRRAGFPVPDHVLVNDVASAIKAANNLGWPVVLKPADCERGEGVTININSKDEIVQAYDLAKKNSSRVLVEKQVPGYNHRIFVVNGQLVFANKKYPRMVVGDGVSSVETLINAFNAKQLRKPNWKRLILAVLDNEALACLEKEGLTASSVPKPDEKIFLRQIGSDQWGSDKDTVTDVIHPDNVDLAAQVANLFGLSVCGLDLMSVDITRPWYETGAVINEVNFKPFFGGDLKNDRSNPYLNSMILNQGRIPIYLILGDGDLWAEARNLVSALSNSTKNVTVTGHGYTELSSGKELHLMCQGLFNRCRALLQNRTLEMLVVVVDSDEFNQTGLPFDEITNLKLVGNIEESMKNIELMLSRVISKVS